MKKRWNISNSQIANCIQDYILAITKVFNGLHIFAQQVAGWLSGRSANQCRGCICEAHHDRWRLAICCRSCRGHATARPNAESGAAGGSSASRSGTVSTMLQGTVQRENVSHSHDQGAKVEPPESIKPGHQGQMQYGSKAPAKVTCWWCDNFETTFTSVLEATVNCYAQSVAAIRMPALEESAATGGTGLPSLVFAWKRVINN